MKTKENYLEKRFKRREDIGFSESEGVITLEIENKGFFNRVAQKIFKKPKISYIHLDEMGSFVWPLIDGEKTVLDVSVFVDEHFGEKAHPLHERLAKYFNVLASYNFIIEVK